MAGYPSFQLDKPFYDQSTFLGRYKHFLSIVDPRTLLTSKSHLQKNLKLLDDYKNGTLKGSVTTEQLWKAQRLKQAIVHPDTGHTIMPLFRMAGCAPFTAPIVAGLMVPNQTVAATVALQVLLQTYNAGFNFSNRNATKNIPVERFAVGYVGAMTSACSITIGLNLLIRRASTFNQTTRTVLLRFVPLPAACVANICNLVLVRFNELWEGIEVMDEDGNTVGTSLIAAKMALRNTALTRIVMLTPIYFLPPIIMTAVETKTTLLKRFRRFHMPFQIMICFAVISVIWPISVSVFPQMSQISTLRLEPEIQQATTADVVTYNKGL